MIWVIGLLFCAAAAVALYAAMDSDRARVAVPLGLLALLCWVTGFMCFAGASS